MGIGGAHSDIPTPTAYSEGVPLRRITGDYSRLQCNSATHTRTAEAQEIGGRSSSHLSERCRPCEARGNPDKTHMTTHVTRGPLSSQEPRAKRHVTLTTKKLYVDPCVCRTACNRASELHVISPWGMIPCGPLLPEYSTPLTINLSKPDSVSK